MKKFSGVFIIIIILILVNGCRPKTSDCVCDCEEIICDNISEDIDDLGTESDEEGEIDRSDYMLLSSEDSIDIYEIGGASYPTQIDISGTEDYQVVGDRILLFNSDYLDIYDFSAAQLNDNYSINIKNSVVKPYKEHFIIFGAEEGVAIYDWNGNITEYIDTYAWIKADAVGDHIFVVYSNDIETYDLDGSNKNKINLPVNEVALLENRIINLYDTGGTVYTWNSGDWEPNSFESPYSDNLVVIGNWIIGVSENELSFYNLDGEPVGDEYYLYSEFIKENVIFP